MPAAMDGNVPLALQTAEESFALAEECAPGFWQAAVVLGHGLILAGRVAEGRDRLAKSADPLASTDPLHDQQLLAALAQLWAWADDPEEARRLLTRIIEAARQHGAPAALPFALAVRCELDTWAGRWAAAYADASEALHWAEDLRQVSSIGHCLACLARLDALRGNRAPCEETIARGRRETGPFHIGSLEVYFTSILGVEALAHGEYNAALGHLETTLDLAYREGLANPNVVPFAADLVEAHIRVGDPVRAAKVLTSLEESARTTGLVWPKAAAARCRGLLADEYEDAELWFNAAETAHRRRETPFEHARTLLCRGEVRRRFRHPATARAPLNAAFATFQSLGAVPWAKRAAAELAAAGQRPTTRAQSDTLDQLTPQEMQVARAIARGLNNSETAASLFVSRKTVEAHLTRVYRKLGIRSRTDLTRTLTTEDLLD